MNAERRVTDMKRLMPPVAVLIIGVVAAALVAAMPQAMLDVLMWRLGLPYILSAATPPIGVFGRIMLALIVLIPFVAVAAIALRQRGFRIGAEVRPALANPETALRVPTIRRADAHPDAAPRRPIRAEEDLGPPLPMMSAPTARRRTGELTLPRDLDQPLAAFDPISIPDVPRHPVRVVPPLAPAPACTAPKEIITPPADCLPVAGPVHDGKLVSSGLDAGGTNDDLATMEAPRSDQPGLPAEDVAAEERRVIGDHGAAAGAGDAESLGNLLDRLERGARQRKLPVTTPAPAPAPAQPETLNDTLSMLRQMARR